MADCGAGVRGLCLDVVLGGNEVNVCVCVCFFCGHFLADFGMCLGFVDGKNQNFWDLFEGVIEFLDVFGKAEVTFCFIM